MSLPEIIPSNLPQYVQNRTRSEFSNSIVPPDSVLLFTESDGSGGSNLITKNPDGTFSQINSGINFYKCASIDTTNHTWTGYKAVIDTETGAWSFESIITNGLTYNNFPVPSIDSVYAGENCICLVSNFYTGFPTEGLIFYLPFTEAVETDATGKTLSILNPNAITYTTFQGIRCARIGYRSHIYGPAFYEILQNSKNTKFTLSCWAYTNIPYQVSSFNFGFVYDNSSVRTYININEGRTAFHVDGTGYWYTDITNDTMANYIVTCEGSYFSVYKNGIYLGQLNVKSGNYGPFGYIQDDPSRTTYCPGAVGQWYDDYDCYIAAMRVYDRVLTPAEIATIASEFTPTIS